MDSKQVWTHQDVVDLQIVESVDLPTLEKASAQVDSILHELKRQDYGPVGKALLADFQALQEKILARINALYGSDGMTLLVP